MPKYLLAYHGGSQPATPEEGAKVTQSWRDWIAGLGDAIVDVGNPTGPAKMLAPNGGVTLGGGDAAVSGYTILQADTLDAAVGLAKGCPQLKANGMIQVAEIVPLM
jgi:hypothetical protein